MPKRSPTPEPGPTANDRFKRGFSNWFWAALVLATLLHAIVFVASPTFAIAGAAPPPTALTLEQIADVPLPPEPRDVPRPAAPVIATDAVDDVTIPETRFDAHPPETLAPPAPAAGDARPDVFTPMTIRPRLQNTGEVARALERHYPGVLRDAGVGGTVTVWFHIDTEGRVRATRLDGSSGYDALDRAALRVAEVMRFSPAYNRDERVAVWVSIPITFEVER